ncbi:cellulose binding domain-containing protein [Actinosynnema pretiosum subsp. pretiosum]|uniref:Cellulose binding domain-containing protein n=1 Tax=Actinosynnema pretiosum subsp. pretiosum TaxID=103721 RepID=A0AA45R4J5_9PSEU|nr:cellulose binding domain-containing protein [Actinosynnema pretiosum subsp. pretiosum]
MRTPFRLAALAAALVAVTGLVVLGGGGGGGTAVAAPACAVDYTPNQWATGFTAEVAVTNRAAPVTTWTLTWTWAGNQTVTSAWNAQVTQTGAKVTARDVGWNGQLGTGATARFGFQGASSGTSAAPTDFALNGTPCNGDTPPTSTTTQPTTTPPTTTTTPQQPTGCGTATLCDDFESQTGTTPSGKWSVGAANCTGTGTVTVDSAVARSGSKSVRVNGGVGYCNHIFFGASVSGPVVHGRFHVRHTTALPAAHVTFMALKDSADGGKDLRMGGQNGALQWNRESDDATLPAQSPQGVAQSIPLPTGRWTCVQFTLDGTSGRLSTSVDGVAVPGLQVDGAPTPDIDQQWLARANWRPNTVDVRLGWESYGDGGDTLWYDDVAFGSAPLAC